MAQNYSGGAVKNFGEATTPRRRMEAYDRLPSRVRQGLANALLDYEAIDFYEHMVLERMTPETLLGFLNRANWRDHKAAVAKAWIYPTAPKDFRLSRLGNQSNMVRLEERRQERITRLTEQRRRRHALHCGKERDP